MKLDETLKSAKILSAWIIFDTSYETWWKEKRQGYTRDIFEAGIYTECEAKAAAQRRNQDNALPLLEELQRKFGNKQEGTVSQLLDFDLPERADHI